MPRTRALAACFILFAFAGCATPPTTPAEENQDQPPIEFEFAQRLVLRVDHIAEDSLLVSVLNDREEPISIQRDAFEYADSAGSAWQPNATATAGFPDAFPETADLDPGEEIIGRIAFDTAAVTTPATLTYERDGVAAHWMLHVSRYPIELEPGQDTSFGSAIKLAAPGTLHVQLHDSTQPIDLCLIEDAKHESWHASEPPAGIKCAIATTHDELGKTLDVGEYNVGMRCPGAEPCSFHLTVVATW